ncbi:MAG: cell division protein FtsA [Bacilli bacterium]|nr:cell division protein FtsA [Bacilli bacterium]
MRRIIASLDIGSDTIKLVVGEIYRNKLNILSALDTPSRGIKKGYIVNSESAVEALKELFDKAENMLGIRVNKVIVSVPANLTECFLSEGVTTITNEDRIIESIDVVRALQASIYNKINPNSELVTVLPTSYTINDIDVVKEPLNMPGQKLSVKAVVVTVPKKNVDPIISSLQKIGVETFDIGISPLGDYYEFKTKENEKLVGAVVNIGNETTTVSIFNRGILTNCEVIDIGGANIDNDLAYVYKLTKSDARNLKEKLTLAHNRLAEPSENMTLTNREGDDIKINQYDSSEIVMSRLEEILNLTKKQINLLTKKEISYIIFTGGVTESKDFELVLEGIYGTRASLSQVPEIGVRDNKYSTCVGLIKYYNSRLKLRNKNFSIFSLEEQEEFSGLSKKVSLSENSVLGKLFGYFFDN